MRSAKSYNSYRQVKKHLREISKLETTMFSYSSARKESIYCAYLTIDRRKVDVVPEKGEVPKKGC
jgi:hypothetical protein